jgi:hypothetical protein
VVSVSPAALSLKVLLLLNLMCLLKCYSTMNRIFYFILFFNFFRINRNRISEYSEKCHTLNSAKSAVELSLSYFASLRTECQCKHTHACRALCYYSICTFLVWRWSKLAILWKLTSHPLLFTYYVTHAEITEGNFIRDRATPL